METAIITLDIVNDICNSKGKVARYPERISSKKIIENINKITAWGRKKGDLIIHVRVGFNSHYLGCSTRSPVFAAVKSKQALALNEWGGSFCDELHIESGDVQVIKHRVSAFYGTDLDLILRANHIERVILTGVATNNAVELTAREAHDRDYEVNIIEDASECASDEEKKASIHMLSRLATCLDTEDLLR